MRWRSLRLALASFVVIGFMGTAAARAVPVSFEFEIHNPGAPWFGLTNTSTTAEIIGMSMSIGDTSKNFDLVSNIQKPTDLTPAIVETLITPDTGQDGVRDDFVRWMFSGFGPGDFFRFDADIDDDASGNTPELVNQVMFNNGSAPNSVVSVLFRDGSMTGMVDLVLYPNDDAPDQATWTGLTAEGVLVPEPGSLALLGSALVGLAGWRKRRKGSRAG